MTTNALAPLDSSSLTLSPRGDRSSIGIHFEGCSFGRTLSHVQILIFHFWSSDQRTTGTRARTDAKNPFHKSKFRRSTPCFKGATSTGSVKSVHFLPSRESKRPSNLFHGVTAYAFCASFRSFFSGKTRISPIFCHCATRWSLVSRIGRSTHVHSSIHFSNSESHSTRSNLFHGDPSHKTRRFQPVFVARTNPLFSGKAASFSTGPQWLC
jgi:hypothetical protein